MPVGLFVRAGETLSVLRRDGHDPQDPATDYERITLELETTEGTQERESGQTTEQFAAQLDGFCQAIRANRPHKTLEETGPRDVHIMQAIYCSAADGGRIVRL